MRPFRIETERRTFKTLYSAAARAAKDRCPADYYTPGFRAKEGTTKHVTIHERGAQPKQHAILVNGNSYLVVMSVSVPEPKRRVTIYGNDNHHD